MNTRPLTWLRAAAAGGLVAAALPLVAAPAPGAAPVAVAYGGFASQAWAAPLRVEIYEPSIPIPAEPQLEFFASYTRVQADSGQSQAKASYLWPGDSIGDGLATFGSELGLPPDVTENGYPAQVNAQFPSAQTQESAETLPGVAMRTETDDKYARAESGFAPSGVSDGADEGGEDGGNGGGNNPLHGLLDLFGGGLQDALASDDAPAGDPNNPLALLVDLAGYASMAQTTAVDGPVIANSRAILGEVRLLSGLVTIAGIEARARTETDGETGQARARASYGTLTIADQEFGIGPDGALVPEEESPIPLFDQLPGDALAQLGITFEVPEPVRDVDGDTAFSVAEGLRIYLDLGVLAPVLQALPTAELGDALPDDFGPLKSLVGGMGNLAPIFVITLGTATAWVDTVPPIDLPPMEEVADAPGPVAGGAEAPTAGAANPGGGDVPAAPAPGNNPPGPDTVGSLTDAAPTSNLPPLFSIPGMLLLAALALGGLIGNWMRIMGAKVLAGGAACAHGLDSGVPDLRKA